MPVLRPVAAGETVAPEWRTQLVNRDEQAPAPPAAVSPMGDRRAAASRSRQRRQFRRSA
jgi:hypothetical protein